MASDFLIQIFQPIQVTQELIEPEKNSRHLAMPPLVSPRKDA